MTIYIISLFSCILALALYIKFSTSFDYSKVLLEPVSIYYKAPTNRGQESNIWKYPIKFVEFTICSLFKEAYDNKLLKDEHGHLSFYKPHQGKHNELQIKFIDFKEEINFWNDIGDNTKQYDFDKAARYKNDNIPDLLISSAFIKGNILPIWSQVIQSQSGTMIEAESFLKQTSYSTWECKFFFDTKFTGTRYRNESYLSVGFEYLLFKVLIPEKYKIVNFENVQLEKISGGYLLRKKLEPGETFHLMLQHPKREMIKTIIGFISPTLFGTVLGMLLP